MFPALTAAKVFANDTNKIEWGAVAYNVQTSISLKNGPAIIKTNQPFSLLVRIRNVSTNQMFHFYLPTEPEYYDSETWVVISPSGKDVSPIPRLSLRQSGAMHPMNPNEMFEFEFKLSFLCKFSEIGTYNIISKINLSGSPHERNWVVSNPLYLTVVPGEWKPETTNAPPFGF